MDWSSPRTSSSVRGSDRISPCFKKMRKILIIACASVTFAAGAQAQDAVKACRVLKDDAERLKCYDRLDTSASNAPRGQRESRPDAETGWVVNDEKSPLDDSPLVSAALASGDGKATLLMRCKDRKTEVAVSIRGFIKCGSDVRMIYRVDQAQATEVPWNTHSSCYLALAPSPIPFVQSLTDDGKVYVRMFDHHDAPYDALFNLGKISKIRSRLAEACDWDGASKATEKPAPAASPGQPKARPK
jgi:Type VI secretion system VasI, EvfG, VC_A0118